jgi:hypothetical protein
VKRDALLVGIGFAGALLVATFILGLSSSFVVKRMEQIFSTKRTIMEKVQEASRTYPIFREDINKIAIYNASYYIDAFKKEINDPVLAERLVIISLEERVPITISIATCYVESKYDRYFNKNKLIRNVDGTYDQGAMGQNSKSFPNIDPFNLEDTLRATIHYLRTKYDKYGTWEQATIFYNCGSEERLGMASLDHLDRILKKEKELMIDFVTFYNESGNR